MRIPFLLSSALLVPLAMPRASADDLDVLRGRVLAPLLTPVEAERVQPLLDAIREDGSWPDIDYTNRDRALWSSPAHLRRVADMARAFRSPASPLQGHRQVLAGALRGLDYWIALDPTNPNWWWNQIGVPRALLPSLLLLDEHLSDLQREGGIRILARAEIGMTGQNLVWVCDIAAGRGLLQRDSTLVADAYGAIADEIRVGMEEGIQPDFSFHQHGPCLYSHGYGAGFIVDCSRIAVLVAGTDFAFPPEKIDVLTCLILDGTQWFTRGTTPDFGAEGREITRKSQSVRHLVSAGHHMLQLPTRREDEFRALADRAAGVNRAPPLQGNRHFWRADMMTHHREGYYASARMHSTRLANTDGPANSEGLLSHHLADGCLVLLRHGREYDNIFGVWDWRKVPGTTVELRPELTGSPRRMGTTRFVGGVSDGTYGLAACDFARDTLSARKSWFFLDEDIVCLGAGISSSAGLPVVTTINQCTLNSAVHVEQDENTRALDPGQHRFETPAILRHDDVAYRLLEPATIIVENGPATGSWHDASHSHPAVDETRNLFSAWIDHGKNPDGDHYAYVVTPNPPANLGHKPPTEQRITITANTDSLQAVTHTGLGLTAAAFYAPGSIPLPPSPLLPHGARLEVDSPCLVLAETKADLLTLTLANPENEPAEIHVELLRPHSPTHTITFLLPGGNMAGSSLTQTLPLEPNPPPDDGYRTTAIIGRRLSSLTCSTANPSVENGPQNAA